MGPCNGIVADAICGDPVWQMIAFSNPGASGCCVGRVGETSCGFVNFQAEPGITASWTNVSPTEIVVVFN